MERLSIDFKDSLESETEIKYLFITIDEYSRYPFTFPCRDTSPDTVVSYLDWIFSLCGTQASILSDRGAAFISFEL